VPAPGLERPTHPDRLLDDHLPAVGTTTERQAARGREREVRSEIANRRVSRLNARSERVSRGCCLPRLNDHADHGDHGRGRNEHTQGELERTHASSLAGPYGRLGLVKYECGCGGPEQDLDRGFRFAVRVHDERETGKEPRRSIRGFDGAAMPSRRAHQDLDAVLGDEPETMNRADREVHGTLDGESSVAEVADVERYVHWDELTVQLAHHLDPRGAARRWALGC